MTSGSVRLRAFQLNFEICLRWQMHHPARSIGRVVRHANASYFFDLYAKALP